MRSLIYLQPMVYPTAKSHSIQITRMVGALGRQVDVLFVVGSLTVNPADLRDAVHRVYGVELGPRVRVAVVAKPWFHTLSFPFGLRKVLAMAPDGAAIYSRSFPIVQKLLRYRWLHGRRVFLETHKKAGYLKVEPVPDSRYRQAGPQSEEPDETASTIRRTYSRADCVFFLHQHSMDVARRDGVVRNAEHVWYGTRPAPRDPPGLRQGFVHCGGITKNKLFDLLLDALDRVRTDVRVSLLGGEASVIAELKQTMSDRPCWGKLDFHPRVDPAALPDRLMPYRHGIALDEAMKVVDYLENGLTPIVPDLLSYREILDDRHALFFRADDPDSLAKVLDTARERTADPDAVRELLDTYSVDRRAAKVVARLTEPS